MTVVSFAKFIDTVPGALMVVARGGQIRLLNQTAAELFGYSKEELADHDVDVLIPEPLRQRHGAHVRGFFSEGARKRRLGPEFELSAARKDGQRFFVEIGLNPISLDGEPMVAAAIRDISERRRDLEALRVSEARQRLVLETAPDPILIVDREGTIEFASRTLDGRDPKLLLGRKMSQFVRASDLPSLVALLSAASAERAVWTLQTELVDLSGTPRQVNFRVRPLDASPTGRVLVVDDEPMICKAMIRTLSPEHSVVAVNTGGQALAMIAAGERFDVILCDLMMPQVTGMELHAQLQQVAPEQAARMVFVTGGAFTPAARAFLEAVPNARLEKPLDSQRLRSVVNHRIPSA